MAVSGLVAGTAFAAQEITEADGHRSTLPDRPVKKPASMMPLAHQVGVDFIPAPMFVLGPIDIFPLMVEDDEALAEGENPKMWSDRRSERATERASEEGSVSMSEGPSQRRSVRLGVFGVEVMGF